MRFPIGVGNNYCYGSGMTAVMWLGMMIFLKTGAENMMRLSLGMMFLISEVLLVGKFRLRISLNKRCILLVQS